MQRRLSRSCIIAFAITLLLAGSFLSTQNLHHLSFEPQTALKHFSLPKFKSNNAESDPPLSSTKNAAPPIADTAPSKPDTVNRPPFSSTSTIVAAASATDATSQASPTTANSTVQDSGKHGKKQLLVDILETNGWHDEVVAALVHSFGSQKYVKLGVYQRNVRYGMDAIMAKFNLSQPVPKVEAPEAFRDAPLDSEDPDIVVATTCETDVKWTLNRLEPLLEKGKTYLYCVVHHGDRWRSEESQAIFTPWLERGMMDFVTLSPHTAKFLTDELKTNWKFELTRPVKHFVPVFPVNIPPASSEGETGEKGELAFALQGEYDQGRRDFKGIFKSLEIFVKAAATNKENQGSNVTLHLLGSGQRPEVLETVKDHVFFDEGLSYADFYSILSKKFALIPAFANDEYLDRKASSSVPASLIGGTPLVASADILHAYSYLPEEAVWLRSGQETEFDVIGRVLQTTEQKRKEKMMKVRETCSKIVEGNVKLYDEWITEAMTQIRGS